MLHSITLSDTNPIRTTPLDEGSARRKHLYLHNTQHTQENSIQAPVGFKRAVPPSERPQTHEFDREATRIGLLKVINDKMEENEVVMAHCPPSNFLTNTAFRKLALLPSSCKGIM